MNCKACGTENDAGRRFCMECGAALGTRSPRSAPRPAPRCRGATTYLEGLGAAALLARLARTDAEATGER